jgi:ABC-type phosphate/phosphonate transport system permease subunit
LGPYFIKFFERSGTFSSPFFGIYSRPFLGFIRDPFWERLLFQEISWAFFATFFGLLLAGFLMDFTMLLVAAIP